MPSLSFPISGVSTKPESALHSVLTWTRSVGRHFPAVVLVLVSALLVSVACCLFLVCQFEYHKKKYVTWKATLDSSGYSTPTHENPAHAAAEPLLKQEQLMSQGAYVSMRGDIDADTAVSSVEELSRLQPTPEERWQRREALRQRLRLRLGDEQQKRQRQRQRRRSLPESPFLTRRESPPLIFLPPKVGCCPTTSSSVSSEAQSQFPSSKTITAEQVKKALALKSLRYQRGHFAPIGGHPVVPLPSPDESRRLRLRRARSLSDVLGMLGHELDDSTTMAMKRRQRSKRNRDELRRQQQQQQLGGRRRKPGSSTSTLLRAPPPHAAGRLRGGPGPGPGPGSGPSLCSSSSSFASLRKRVMSDQQQQRLSQSRNSFVSRTESQDTLKAARSQSSFSGRSSAMSGDQELEFDLYDYNLDNAQAYNPGSLFATQFWPAALPDLTPTNELQEEFQMRELFPREEDEDGELQRRQLGDGAPTSSSSGEATFSSPEKGEGEEAIMLRSRTSDLTASVTSADLRSSNVATPSNNNLGASSVGGYDTDGESETDALLGPRVAPAANTALMLNLTHIDDDISFADDDANHANDNDRAKPSSAADAKRRFLSTQC